LKILLDENIPHDLRPYLSHHEAFTLPISDGRDKKTASFLTRLKKTGSMSW
jgi:hypothetical protein